MSIRDEKDGFAFLVGGFELPYPKQVGSEREASCARLQANSRSERDLFWKEGAME